MLDFPLFTIYRENFPAYRAFMLLVAGGMLGATWLLLKRTRIGLIIQAALSHPSIVSALGHDVPLVFTIVFAGGCLLAGLAGVLGGNYQTTTPGMADALAPIIFLVVVFRGLGLLVGCFISSIILGLVTTICVVTASPMPDRARRCGDASSYGQARTGYGLGHSSWRSCFHGCSTTGGRLATPALCCRC